MIDVVYKWDDIMILVQAPSCIACVECRDPHLDEDDCICAGSGGHHNLADKCKRFELALNRERFNMGEW